MSTDFFKDFYSMFNFFDLVFLIILIYFTIQCTMKGFTLSLISFMKWVLSLILTIIFLPKVQPWVSNYIDSPFLNDIGLGFALYVIFLFSIIIFARAFKKSVRWTGLGSVDKIFGLFFGLFKGYVVAVCLYSITNWFYPYNNWDIDTNKSYSFKIVQKGSLMLLNEFPNYKDFEKTKEKIENI